TGGANCAIVQFTTDSSNSNYEGWIVRYHSDPAYDTETAVETAAKGTFSNDRYIPFQYDTWFINPSAADTASVSVTCTGTTEQDADYLSVWSARCDGTTNTPTTLVTRASGTINLAETVNLDWTSTDTSVDNCVSVQFQTDGVTPQGADFSGITCTYTSTQ
ncbi:hypothetical protein KIPB_014751, partial [Kipferlia bialata]